MMPQFWKYFFIVLAVQAALVGFVVLTVFVFGSAVGDGVLYLLYAIPWIVLQQEPPGPSDYKLLVAALIPAVIYSALASVGISLILARVSKPVP